MSTYGSERDQRQNRYRPNVSVKHLTNKSALMSFVAPRQVDAIDRIPSGSRIYAEMHRQESNEEMEVQCHGIDPTGFTCRVAHRESDDQQSSGDATVGHAE